MRILDRLILKYSSAFRLYADCFHFLRKHFRCPGTANAINKADPKQVSDIQPFQTLTAMIEDAENKKYRIYGKDLLSHYDAKNKMVLMVSHDMTLSGAPIVLYYFGFILQKLGLQVLIISPEDGRLAPYAQDHGIPVMIAPDLFYSDYILRIADLFSRILVNTIVCAPVIQQLQKKKVPVMWWIHECAAAYSPDYARQMPRTLSDNIHVYCVGSYAQRMLTKRCPHYKTKILLFYEPDLSKRTNRRIMENDSNCILRHSAAAEFPRKNLNKTVSDQKVFVTAASINYRKGQDILLKAIDLLPEQVRRHCQFLIIGAVQNNSMYEQIADMQAQYPEQICYMEELAIEELYDLYQSIDFLICPSRDEPMSAVVVEVMSLGKPSICSINGGVSAFIAQYEAGFIYPNNSPKLLADRITEAYQITDSKYQELSVHARQAYEDVFSEDVFQKNVIKVLSLQ